MQALPALVPRVTSTGVRCRPVTMPASADSTSAGSDPGAAAQVLVLGVKILGSGLGGLL